MTRSSYLPGVDGLRALAVILVVLCHAKFSWMAGGYIGVDVFFVISGYVVCRSILNDQDQQRFRLRDFYTRRLKRLAPSLYLVMAATLGFGLLYNFPDNNLALIKNIGFVALFYSNVYLAKQTGYFDLQADKQPLLHTWSLSVEEQFYLIVPLLLIATRQLRAPARLALFGALWSAALAYSWYSVSHTLPGAYFYLQGRVFEFLCGILLALLLHARPLRVRSYGYDALLLAGLAIIVWCGVHYTAQTAMPGLAALWPCIGAVLVIAGVQGARGSQWLLANRGSVFGGQISYVLYLWHWPVIYAFNRLGLNSAAAMSAALGVSLLLAVATHYAVENPLRRAPWPPKKTALLLFVLPVLACVALLLTARQSNSFLRFYPERYQQDFRDSGNTVFQDPRAKLCWSKDGVTPADHCTLGAPGARRKAAFLGDSHAYHLIDFMDQLGKEHGLAIHDMTFTMCAPIENSPARAGEPGFQQHAEECRRHDQQVLAHVLAQQDISIVFMAAVWDLYANNANDGKPNLHGFMPQQINTELAATIGKLEAAGKRVIFLDDIPVLPAALEDCVSNRVYLPGRAADRCSYARAAAADRYRGIAAILDDMRARFPRSATIHTYDVACDATECHAELGGTGLYAHNDPGHLGKGGGALYYRAYQQRHPGELAAILGAIGPVTVR